MSSSSKKKQSSSSKKQPVPIPVSNVDGGKHHRRLSVVGGTSSVPSLRERVRHRSRKNKRPPVKQRQQRRSQSANAMFSPVAIASPGPKMRTKSPIALAQSSTVNKLDCDLCRKMKQYWAESEGLRKKTWCSDVTLHAPDGKYFYCNSFVLAVWSKPLLTGARCEKGRSSKECEEWIVDVDVFSGEVLHTALRLMYGGSLSDLQPRHLSGVVKMADRYKMNDLKRACFEAASSVPLKVEEACAMWTFAEEYSLSEACERIMRYVYTNLEEVSAGRDWERVSHNSELLLKLFEASVGWTTGKADWRSFKADPSELDNHANPFVQGVKNLWRESVGLKNRHAFSDKVIIAKGARQFHVHSQIIHAGSLSFANYLADEAEAADMNEIRMDDFDDDVVEEFLRHLYCQEPSDNFPNLASLVHVLASTYEMDELVRLCEYEMAAQEMSSIDKALEMLRESEEHRMATAKSVCFRYLYGHLDEVRQHDDWRQLIFDEPQLLTEMMLESRRFRSLVDRKE